MEIKNVVTQFDPYKAALEKAEQVKAEAKAPARKQGAAQGDTISFSPEAQLRTDILSTAMNTPDVRQAKVDALRAQVESGAYQVDARALADKLLREEPGLFEI